MTRGKWYSAEFKHESLRRANEEGVTDVLVAEELGINARQLRRWREAAKQEGDKAFPGPIAANSSLFTPKYRSIETKF